MQSNKPYWITKGRHDFFEALCQLEFLERSHPEDVQGWRNLEGKCWRNTRIESSREFKIPFFDKFKIPVLGDEITYNRGLKQKRLNVYEPESKKRFPKLNWPACFVGYMVGAPHLIIDWLGIPAQLNAMMIEALVGVYDEENIEHRLLLGRLGREEVLASWEIPGLARYIRDENGSQYPLEHLDVDGWIYEIGSGMNYLLDLSSSDDRDEFRELFLEKSGVA